MVTINSGANSQDFPVAGYSVSYVRDRFGEILGIATGAKAFVNGVPVSEAKVLEEDCVLVFTQVAAEKGR